MAEQKTHLLKVREPFWSALRDGTKTFEVRKNDRDFRAGDELVLARYPRSSSDTVVMLMRVTYVLTHECFQAGIMPGYCVLGIDEIFSVTSPANRTPAIAQFRAEIESWEEESDD